MSESGCVATVELMMSGAIRKMPCPNRGVICNVAGESFSVDVVLCKSHWKIAESEGFRVRPVEISEDSVQSHKPATGTAALSTVSQLATDNSTD